MHGRRRGLYIGRPAVQSAGNPMARPPPLADRAAAHRDRLPARAHARGDARGRPRRTTSSSAPTPTAAAGLPDARRPPLRRAHRLHLLRPRVGPLRRAPAARAPGHGARVLVLTAHLEASLLAEETRGRRARGGDRRPPASSSPPHRREAGASAAPPPGDPDRSKELGEPARLALAAPVPPLRRLRAARWPASRPRRPRSGPRPSARPDRELELRLERLARPLEDDLRHDAGRGQPQQRPDRSRRCRRGGSSSSAGDLALDELGHRRVDERGAERAST